MQNIFHIFKKAREKPAEPSYHKIPFTLALRKRRQEEEQFAKYHVAKEKFFEIQ